MFSHNWSGDAILDRKIDRNKKNCNTWQLVPNSNLNENKLLNRKGQKAKDKVQKLKNKIKFPNGLSSSNLWLKVTIQKSIKWLGFLFADEWIRIQWCQLMLNKLILRLRVESDNQWSTVALCIELRWKKILKISVKSPPQQTTMEKLPK